MPPFFVKVSSIRGILLLVLPEIALGVEEQRVAFSAVVAIERDCRILSFRGKLRHALLVDSTCHFDRVERLSEQLDLAVFGYQTPEEELVNRTAGLR
jgi:hypothetical protein